MNYGLWLSAAGLQANQYRQALIANNLANANTVGFKHDLAVIRERPTAVVETGRRRFAHDLLDGLTGGSVVAPTYTTFAQGPIEPTSRALDVAIDGQGFFTIRTGEGTRYTRDGRFTIDRAGRLVTTAGGRPVLDAGGNEIVVATGVQAEPPRIDERGRVMQGERVVAQMGLVDFADKQRLRKIGSNLFDAMGEPPIASRAKLRPGAVEGSTVSPVLAMATMIEVSRAYQLNANLISMQDQMNGRAASDIGRIG